MSKKPPNKKVHLKNLAVLYALWKSMPFILHELTPAKLSVMGYDVEDETFQKLIGCRTQTDFHRAFKVARYTLTKWDKNPEVQKMIEQFNLENNVFKFKKDIDYHFTQATIKEADAARVKLWKELFEGWTEKQNISVQSEELKKVSEQIKGYIEKK